MLGAISESSKGDMVKSVGSGRNGGAREGQMKGSDDGFETRYVPKMRIPRSTRYFHDHDPVCTRFFKGGGTHRAMWTSPR